MKYSMSGIIFSNMHDECLNCLTDERTFASVPFASKYRLIDFVLSNMVNSKIENIGIITKHNYRSLIKHIGSGKPWDLDRKNGGVTIISPFGNAMHGVYHDRLEALFTAYDFLLKQNSEYVVLSDCNTVVNINLKNMLLYHIDSDADITLAYKQMNVGENGKEITVFDVDENGKITDISEAPQTGGRHNVDLNIWIIKRELLKKILDDAKSKHYKSLMYDVLKNGLAHYNLCGFKIENFAYKIMSPEGYFKANMLLLSNNRDNLFSRKRPVYTKVLDNAPTLYGKNSKVINSLVGDGCEINGNVENSVIFCDVVIEEGARVSNSIIMDECVICKDAELSFVVADKNVTVRGKKSLCGDENFPVFIKKDKTI